MYIVYLLKASSGFSEELNFKDNSRLFESLGKWYCNILWICTTDH